MQDGGNYWGHNAIIRTEPFMKYCDLPRLPGRKPFGGHILSHDFVEAALLRRENWEVWFAWDFEGSYEESPPGIIESAKRDRRWCQGNLQHAYVAFRARPARHQPPAPHTRNCLLPRRAALAVIHVDRHVDALGAKTIGPFRNHRRCVHALHSLRARRSMPCWSSGL
jgi:hypothetical protein